MRKTRLSLCVLVLLGLFSLSLPSTSAQFDPNAWNAEYFANRNLQGTPVIQRTVGFINHYWGTLSPHINLQPDNFSVRWTKTAVFAGELQPFYVAANDGVRLYLDNNLIIDQWRDQPYTVHSTTVPISAGTHTLKLEYYDGPNLSVVSLGNVGDDYGVTVTSSENSGVVGNVQVRIVDFLRLRNGPGLQYDYTDIVDWGTIASVTGRSRHRNWIRIQFNGKSGWVYVYYTRLVNGSFQDVPVVD